MASPGAASLASLVNRLTVLTTSWAAARTSFTPWLERRNVSVSWVNLARLSDRWARLARLSMCSTPPFSWQRSLMAPTASSTLYSERLNRINLSGSHGGGVLWRSSMMTKRNPEPSFRKRSVIASCSTRVQLVSPHPPLYRINVSRHLCRKTALTDSSPSVPAISRCRWL